MTSHRGRSRLLLVAFGALLLLLPACQGTNRPEGVVERWLVALNQGSAGRPGQYAPEPLSQQILPHWASRDPGDIDTIEVGRATSGFGVHLSGTSEDDNQATDVPYRVVLVDGRKEEGEAVLHQVRGSWRVTSLNPPSILRVPSEGGQRIGSASLALWLGSLGVALILTLITIALMATVGRDRALLRPAEPPASDPVS